MAKFKTHIFKAGGGNLKITIEPAKPLFKDGQKVGDQPGKYADFVGGVFETDDKKVIEYLRSRPTFGVDFFEVPEEEGSKEPAQPKEPALESLTKSELVEIAKSRNIEVDEGLTKAELVERLKEK